GRSLAQKLLPERVGRLAALARVLSEPVPGAVGVLQPRQQSVLREEPVHPPAASRAVIQVGGDVGQVVLADSAQGKGPEFFRGRVRRVEVVHGQPCRTNGGSSLKARTAFGRGI